ncbi:methyltransferase domain-containing protein [Leptospira bouyouniensis]|uniref:Methyltransferase domain-containing protein n=2 Tax=Leptospira bouyouniensis TaxID=2484911 RepID=A0A7I0HQT3_9LEPT|nr:methyltransferase domain-containing protein [Leptospira bouyouniensis]
MRNLFLKAKTSLGVGEPMTDQIWDKFLPVKYQTLSPYQWTPISVVLSTWEYLREEKVSSVVDLGSGVGKFCLNLARVSEHQFPILGIEDRKELFQIADSLREKWNFKKVKFEHGNFLKEFPYGYSHYYCFNPLYETMKASHSIDGSKDKSAILFIQNLQLLKNHFLNCKIGTKIITYHGFGGSTLPGFKVLLKKELEFGEWMVWERV